MNNHRNDFPFIHSSGLIYLDNAATSHKPQVVIDALTNFYTQDNAPVHRGVYDLAEHTTQQYEAARATVARFINADNAAEIVFTRNTTEGINLIATAWARQNLRSGDEIVITELEHHSNIVPWMQIAQERGAIVRWIPTNADATLNIEHLDAIITSKTKLVAITHSSNIIGQVDPQTLQTIISAAKTVGARVCIDAAQAMIHRRINVQALGCDFLVFSGHKMFGPTGIGVVYIRQLEHKHLMPYQTGGGMIYQVSSSGATWRSMPHLLEAGSPHIAGAIGLATAINYLNKLDFAAIEQHEAILTARLVEGLQQFTDLHLIGPADVLAKGHMVSFYSSRMHPHDLAAYLSAAGIAVRAGNHCCQPLHQKLGIASSVRISFALYNTLGEVDAMLACLSKALQ